MTSIHFKEENLLPSNAYIEDCEYVPTQDFDPFYVKQVVASTDKLFTNICDRVNLNPVSERQLVQRSKLNIRSVTKEKLIEWLENACYLLDTCSIPLLQQACEIEKVQNICKLQREKIEDQKSIIDLQKKLLKQNEEGLRSVETVVQNAVQNEMKSVKTTVKTEMKSYSSVLTSSVSAPISEKKIISAVKSATEKEDRKRNVIIYGVEEMDNEVLPERVSGILLEIGEKPAVRDSCRVGIKKSSNIRPIKFTLSSSDVVCQVLRKAKLLRLKEGFKSVYLCPDRTIEERRAYKKLLHELKLKSEAEPNKSFVIRNNKIVSASENSSPASAAGT